jgi:hypothetical protein
MNNQSSNNTASTRRIARATILTPLRRHSLPTNSAMVAVSWHVGRALLQEDRPNSTQSKDFQKKIARPRRWPSPVVGDTITSVSFMSYGYGSAASIELLEARPRHSCGYEEAA